MHFEHFVLKVFLYCDIMMTVIKMDVKKFFLSGYKNATENFYIEKITEPKDALKPHTHNYFQIYFCKRGKLTHYLENTSSTLFRGDVFVLPPDTVHYIEKEVPDTVFYSISFTFDFAKESEPTNKFPCDFLSSLQNSKKVYPKLTLAPEDIVFAECILSKMFEEFSEKKLACETVIKDLLFSLITIIARLHVEQTENVYADVHSKKQLISYCISYIDIHFSESIYLDDIAKKCAMSKTTFCTLFRQATGMSFKEYLNKKRIQKAISLMKNGEKISAAARKSGFGEISTFYRNFVKYTDYSPEQYIKKHRIIKNEIKA